MPIWRDQLREYLAACASYHEAHRKMIRAERLAWKHLAKRVGEDRAYLLAGVALADARSTNAWSRRSEAFKRLKKALRSEPMLHRLSAAGAHICLWNRTANDN